MREEQPKVGIGVMVFRNGKVLLGERKGSHGAGEYAFPGGHLEYMETIEDCARREVWEETGIEIENMKFQFLVNIRAYKPKHYVHIGMAADYKGGKVQLKEPDKCAGWDWYDLDNLPEPLFKMAELSFGAYKEDKVYFNSARRV